ncbi:hypothetical protein Hypma_010528 [Hypsizygus marmoreus]|uniref:Uncharacterized protein n=1 Tax=Hypsizygus marmoreus TaxID=39966 RepID=A0A369JRQ4_HYPMA|nr:hypothetical protein Hypma_010528 [Hypsizygus marmoreus]
MVSLETMEELSAMATKNLKMPWVGWADVAYKFKVCLINWLCRARAPARGFDIKSPECILQSVIQECNRLWQQAEVDNTVMNYVKVIPWSDDDLLLDIDDVTINDVPLAAEKKKKEQQKGKP